jgi:hypothetical protein
MEHPSMASFVGPLRAKWWKTDATKARKVSRAAAVGGSLLGVLRRRRRRFSGRPGVLGAHRPEGDRYQPI